jgi:hypothetical protein
MSNARSSCQNKGGDLALPRNIDEHNAIWKMAKEKKFTYPWIGLVEREKEKFYTLDGKTPTYTNWGSRQPDPGGYENCVIYYLGDNNGRWHDAPCNTNNYYICQRLPQKCTSYKYNIYCMTNKFKFIPLHDHIIYA